MPKGVHIRTEREKERLRLINVGRKRSKESVEQGVQTRKECVLKRGYFASLETRKKMSDNHWNCSGDKSSQYGTKWICNIVSGNAIKVKKEQVPEYLSNGWVYGRSEKEKQHMSTGHTGKKRSRESVEKGKLTRKDIDIRRGYHHSSETISKILGSAGKHPNKFEKNAMNYLSVLYPGKFQYTGNGTMIVNHRSADAYSKELNTIALFNGYYWHLKKIGYEVTDKNKRIVERFESQPFLSAGHKVIFIWEDELTILIKNKQSNNIVKEYQIK